MSATLMPEASTPAELTRIVGAPNASRALANTASTAFSSRTSAAMATARPPADAISATILSAASRWS